MGNGCVEIMADPAVLTCWNQTVSENMYCFIFAKYITHHFGHFPSNSSQTWHKYVNHQYSHTPEETVDDMLDQVPA